MKNLGKTKTGHEYHGSSDGYVYQKLPNGQWNGWLCSKIAWNNGLKNILNDK